MALHSPISVNGERLRRELERQLAGQMSHEAMLTSLAYALFMLATRQYDRHKVRRHLKLGGKTSAEIAGLHDWGVPPVTQPYRRNKTLSVTSSNQGSKSLIIHRHQFDLVKLKMTVLCCSGFLQ